MARAPRRVRARAGRHWRRWRLDDSRRPRRRAAGRPRSPRRRHRRLQCRPDERAAGRAAEHPLLPADPLARRGRCPPRALARHARLSRPGRRRPATRHRPRAAPAVAMLCTKVIEQVDELLDRPDAEWPLAEPAHQAPEIRDQLLEVIGQEIRPAFERYRAVIVDEIAPNARPDDRPGLSAHPGWRRGVSAPDPRAHLARHRPRRRARHRSR